jgi:hypothetical protein
LWKTGTGSVILQNSSHYGLLSFLRLFDFMELHIWLEQLRLLHDNSHRVRIVCKVGGNRTACRCHDIQISEQQWNEYGINTCRIRTHIRYRRQHFGHETKQEHGHTSSFATFDDFSTSFVNSIQSRPSVLSEIHMFCKPWFLFFFLLVSLPAFRLCGRGDPWGC